MLHTVCPRAARALRAGQRRARRQVAFGSFALRTVSRRLAGIIASGSCRALSRLQSPTDPYGHFALARLAGGHADNLLW